MALGLFLSTQAAYGAEATLRIDENGVEKATITSADVGEHTDISPNWMAVDNPEEPAGQGMNRPGASLAEIAILAGISPETVAENPAVTVSGSFGDEASLNKSEAFDGIPNPVEPAESSAFPVFFSFGSEQILFFLPLRSTEDRKPWGGSIGTSAGGALDVDFSTSGEPLNVSVNCPASILIGEEMTCTAGPKEGSGDGWTYSWNFGEERTEAAEGPSHIYVTPGTYWVTVNAKSGIDAGPGQTKVRVEEKSEPPGPPDPQAPPGPGTDSGADPGLSAEPHADHQGSGEAPPQSVSAGPDRSRSAKSSKGSVEHHHHHHHHHHKQKSPESFALGTGVGGGSGAGGGEGAGVGTGDEPGATAGPGAAGHDLGDAPLERTLSRQGPAPRSDPNASRPEPLKGKSRPRGPVIEGLKLSRTTAGNESLIEAAASEPRASERLQQAAAGGRGSNGSAVGPIGGFALVLLALGVGGAVELISANRRRGLTLGATP